MSRKWRPPTAVRRATEAAATKDEGGDSFPAAAYAYVPDATKPSGWKLRLWETPDGGPTAKQVGMALAALSPGGFRGQKVQIPDNSLPAVKKKIYAAWEKVHGDDGTEVPAVLKGSEALAGDRTMDEMRNLVSSALQNHVNGYPWLLDMSDDWVAYENNGKTYKQGYSVDDDGNVTFNDDETEVEPRKIYTPVEPGNETEPLTSTEAGEPDRIHGRLLGAKGTDATGGRVFDVQIIAYGDSRNNKRYPQAVMKEAASKYEGAKAYDHHRTDAELATSTISGLVGHYESVKPTSTGLSAELHLLPSATHAAEALDASLANQEKGLSPLVGISHDVMARYKPIHVDGQRFMEATEIVSVNSSDVVADPAAGGLATRMVAGGTGADVDDSEGDAMKLKELLKLLREADATKRAELLTEHKATLEEYGLDDAAVTRILSEDGGTTETGTETGTETEETTETTETTETLVGAATESYRRDSAIGGVLIRDTASRVGLDVKFVEAATKRLPEKFTEAQLLTELTGFKELRQEFEREALGVNGGTVPHVQVTKEALEAKTEKLFNSLSVSATAKTGERYRSFKEAFIDITGITPRYAPDSEDFNRVVLRESIGDGNYDSGVRRGVESAQASTWNLILGDSITRRMVADYEQPNLQTWRSMVSSIVPVQDFRTQRIDRFGGYGVLPGVNEGAPYQGLTTPGNEEATYAITKRGGTEDLTLETIANDDLRLVARIPQRLGLAAAQTLYRFVWDMLNTNASYTPDSTTLFSSGHTNTDTNALARSAMDTGRRKMRAQAAYGDSLDILSLVPKTLVVNSTLENLAWEFVTSAVALPTAAPDGAAANQPNIYQGLNLVVVDYWSSTTTWFLVADPDMCPLIEVGFYQGRQEPELFVQNDPTVGSVFTADKITYKIRHIYSGTPLDFRGFYRGNT